MLKVKNLKQAQKKAEEKFNSDRGLHLMFMFSGQPKPNKEQKDQLRANYPIGIKLIATENEFTFVKNGDKNWQELK